MKFTIIEQLENFIILKNNKENKRGLLFPHNIVYKGNPISLPFAIDVLKRIEKDKSLLEKVYVISTFGSNSEFEMLAFDCKTIFKIFEDEEPLVGNKIYKATILAVTESVIIVGVHGHYGSLSNKSTHKVGDTLNVMIVSTAANNYSFCKFIEVDSNTSLQNSDSIEKSQPMEEFLDKEEFAVISQGDKNLIQRLLDGVNGTTRRNINICRQQIHLTYNPNTHIDLQKFLKDNPTYFKENNFWLGAYRENKKSEDIKFILYDKNDLVIAVLADSKGFNISDFSHDKNKSNTQYLLNCKNKAIAISGNNLLFHSETFYEEGYIEKKENLYLQYNIATTFLPNLKKDIKTLKEKAGTEYLTLKNYIDYQQRQEQQLHDSNSVVVCPMVARITTSSDGTTALFLPKEKINASILFNDNEDVCYVDIQFSKGKPFSGRLKETEDDGFVLKFHNTHSSLESYREEGFELRRSISRHFKVQTDSIENFVFSKDEFDIFEKLNQKDLQPPEPDMSLTFFDAKFNNVEEGNNQPLAIRKAVNNEDVFLIQGPPGTGKTSVIVEIIKQLVKNKNEKVLVCSQAHSAVDNIYQRIKDSGLKIGNIDEDSTMAPDDLLEHIEYIKNNLDLIDKLSDGNSNSEKINGSIKEEYEYKSSSKDMFTKGHEYIFDYFKQNTYSDYASLKDIVTTLQIGLSELGNEATVFNNAQLYRGLDVVMGTCIGVGLDLGLKKSGLKFDTVIIDEAGKANLSETTVPMQLGRKYILVGDSKQLPPYMDSNEISNFIEDSKLNLSKPEVENAISSSLFEDFLQDSNFPKENTILLNYQYRMNPDIGNYISKLFYGGDLHNGRGTEQQICGLDGFPNAVTFIDTSSNKFDNNRNIAWESGNSQDGYYNLSEIEVFKKRLLPKLLRLYADNTSITFGIITPYRKQRQLLLNVLKGTPIEKCVYTIDSIQGGEFDIVILSLVRSFETKSGKKKVGFLDDMRRLNVALSRAKKKLIIIGNLNTLCEKNAHREEDINTGISPVNVFESLKTLQDRTAEMTYLDKFRNDYNAGLISKGKVFKKCKLNRDRYNQPNVELILSNGDKVRFPLNSKDYVLNKYAKTSDLIDVKFDGFFKGQAHFSYIPNVPIAVQIEDGCLKEFYGAPIEWKDDDRTIMKFRFDDGSEGCLKIIENGKNSLFYRILDSPKDFRLPLYIYNEEVNLNKKHYDDFAKRHAEGSIVEVEVIDDLEDRYIAKCEDIYGEIIKRKPYMLKVGLKCKVEIYRHFFCNVEFKIK